jgi:hypothetical protein
MIWFYHFGPILKHWFVEGLVDDIWNALVFFRHVMEENLCIHLILIGVVIMPIDNAIQPKLDSCVTYRLHTLTFTSLIAKIATMLNSHRSTNHINTPIVS